MRLSRLCALLLAVALAAASCGQVNGTIQPTQAPSPTSTSVSGWGSIQVVVDTSKNRCMDELAAKPGSCYLRLYTQPTSDEPSTLLNSAAESKCTPQDERKCWPQPNTELTALCQAEGPSVRDSEGMTSSVWYAVIVPPEELLIARYRVASTNVGEAVGFASTLWLRRLIQREPPQCKGIIAYG